MTFYIFILYILVIIFSRQSSILCLDRRSQRAAVKQQYQNMVQMTDSVKRLTSDSLICCLNACLDSYECVTFFHNKKTRDCVLHSNDFTYLPPKTTEEGWKFYVTRDVTGRCPYPYIYNKRLGFCYSIGTIDKINFNAIRTMCDESGGRLAAVESFVKEQYLLHIHADRLYTRIPIDGSRTGVNTWTLEDGINLTYLNWGNGRPKNHLCLEIHTDNKLIDCPCSFTHPGTFVCEK